LTHAFITLLQAFASNPSLHFCHKQYYAVTSTHHLTLPFSDIASLHSNIFLPLTVIIAVCPVGTPIFLQNHSQNGADCPSKFQ
jgi:hypothetical protein